MEDEEVNLMENKEDDVEQSLFLALKEDSIRKANTWYLDNRASNHMTCDKSKSVELDTNKKGFVSFGDNTKLKIEGNGTILLETKNGGHKDVLIGLEELWTYVLEELYPGSIMDLVYEQKSEVFDTFTKFKAFVEKVSRYQIQALRTDRDGEFTYNEFNNFCELHGIRRLLTVPRSPQQNRIAERKNMTILNMTMNDEPLSFEEAKEDEKWRGAMEEEMQAL
ncbi:uncharacterized protein LOC121999812 [Zingiber officinale]|uniref:uncharacterized protein LOC121999812 n=1 Tax=Zingiber officinale TaxID=94328 RepID=UPI001C4D177D|nr:uncharacterized protein LOC121999812 [Zingiber officinale]